MKPCFTRTAVACRRAAAHTSRHNHLTHCRYSDPVTQSGERGDWFCDLLLTGLIGAVAWAPFWLGGNRPLAWGINGVVFPGLALLYEARVLLSRRTHAVSLRYVGVSAGLFSLVVVWIVLQCAAPSPLGFAHPAWRAAGDALGRPLAGAISVNRAETGLALLRLLTDVSAFWLALQLSRNASRAFSLLSAIAWIGAGYAIAGLLLSAFFDNAIPLIDAPPPQGALRSTFVNRNHFATYAGLGLIVSVGLALHRLRHASMFEWRDPYRSVLSAVAPIGLSLVIFAALLGTASRGGVVATGIGLLVLIGLHSKHGDVKGAIISVTLMLIVGFAAFSGSLATRLSAVGLDGAARLATYRVVFGSILDNPLTGLGYGAFIDAFPLYRDQSIPTVGIWDKAHNSYLETLQGLGVFFGAALIIALGLLVVRCFAGARHRRRDATAPAVAAAASTLVAVHAMVDFSFQIEGVALTFMTILGAGVAQSESSRVATGD